MLHRIFKNRISDTAVERGVYRISLEGEDLYVSGFEVLVRLDGKKAKEDLQESAEKAIRNMVQMIREKISRSSQIYIITRITKYLGGTVVICLDRKPESGLICRLASSMLEAISNRIIRTRELSQKELINTLMIHRKYGGELLSLNSFFTDEFSLHTEDLPLPRVQHIADGIPIGETTRSRVKQRIYIPVESIVRHIAIFGSTGSGKSTTAASLAIRSRRKGVRVIILDWHGEYRDLIGGYSEYKYIAVNTSLVASMLEKLATRSSLLLEILESVLELSPAQSHLLSTVIRSIKDATNIKGNIFEKIASYIEVYREDARWISETKFSLLRKIQPFLEESFENEGRIDINEIFASSFTIMDLSTIDRETIKALTSLSVLKILEILSKENRDFMSEKKLVIVDEAHHIFKRSEGASVIRNMLSETRKWNLGIAIISQSPSSLGEDSLKNTNTKIIHSIKSDIDRKIVRESTVMPRELEEILPALDIGEAVLASPAYPIAILVKIYPPDHDRDAIDLR
ncbi:MAG: ATP-binding protein [Sulfolobales archaeon]